MSLQYPAVPQVPLNTRARLIMDGIFGSPGTEVRSLVCSANTCVIQQQLGRRPTAYMYRSIVIRRGIGWGTCCKPLHSPHHPAFFLCRDTSPI